MLITAGTSTSPAFSSLSPKPGDGYSPRMMRMVKSRNIAMPTSTPLTFETRMFLSFSDWKETTGLGALGSQ